jgi:hypothetical protein
MKITEHPFYRELMSKFEGTEDDLWDYENWVIDQVLMVAMLEATNNDDDYDDYIPF